MAFSIEALHAALTAADPAYRGSPAVLRLSRLIADLDFRARTAGRSTAALADTLGDVQVELAQVDADIAQRYFGGPAAARRPAGRRRMNFAIRYLTEYRYERARSRTTSTRCASSRRRWRPRASRTSSSASTPSRA